MMMVKAIAKGKTGENEACDWLSQHLFDMRFQVKRNQNQMQYGHDIGCSPFIIEVKRRETLSLSAWWMQIVRARNEILKDNKEYIPVVMFRQNRKPWEFLISSESIGVPGGFVRLDKLTFKKWARKFVEGNRLP